METEIGDLAAAERELEGRLGFLREALPHDVDALQAAPRRAAHQLAEGNWDAALHALEKARASVDHLRACLAADRRIEQLARDASELPHRLGVAALAKLPTLRGPVALVDRARRLLAEGEVVQADFLLDLCAIQLRRSNGLDQPGMEEDGATRWSRLDLLRAAGPRRPAGATDTEVDTVAALAKRGYVYLARNLADDLATLRAEGAPHSDAASLLPSITETLAELSRLNDHLARQELSVPPLLS